MSEHLREDWHNKIAMSHSGWQLPPKIREYDLPIGGQFAGSKSSLSPDIFDSKDQMLPGFRFTVLGLLGSFWAGYKGPWTEWSRVYLAGSLASYWHGTPDVDILIGVDTNKLTKDNPEFEGLSEHEVCSHFNAEFALDLNPKLLHYDFPAPSNLKNVEVTYYVNAGSYDIRVIKPYAAYCINEDKWYVHPSKMDKKWGPSQMSWQFWSRCADIADHIKKIQIVSDPTERQNQALEIYVAIHTQRNEAFSPFGGGVMDWRSLQWITLNRWGVLGILEALCHPERGMSHIPPALARINATDTITQ
jgi:hypothetical protein